MNTSAPSLMPTEKINGYHWIVFLICFLATLFGGTVSTLMSVYLPIAVRDLLGTVSDDQYNNLSAYINAVFVLGWALGGIVLGILSDRIGRAKVIFISIICYSSFTLLTGIVPTWPWIVLCRFASGVGIGGVLVTTPTLLSEVWPSETKAIIIGILSVAFPIGIFSAGAIDLLVDNWRHAFMIGFIPLSLSIYSLWIIQESEKWQQSSSYGHTTATKLKTLISQNHRKDLVMGSLIFGTMLIGLWAIFLWLPTWIQSILTSSDGQTERGVSMMLLGAGGLTGGFVSGWFSNSIGQKKAMMLCFAGCLIMSFLLFKITHVFSGLVYAGIAILALFFGASQGILSSYIPQLFPFSMRATATGFCFNLGRLITAVIVFFIGALVIALGGYGNAIFVFSLMFLVGLISVYFSKEVKTND